jgi:hypothetical protein
MMTKGETRSRLEARTRKIRTRKIMLTRKSRRRMRIGRRPLPRRKMLTRRKSRDAWIWHWCKHHMAWGGHKEGECRLGKERINQQNGGLNQVVAQAALATIHNPEWQALMANMARNMAND